MINSVKIWVQAFRLRTLPLALSTALVGSALAFKFGSFSLSVFLLAIFTIVLLQIISNLSNDYGDAVSGADNQDRVGPQRVTQSGLVSLKAMKRMIAGFIFMAIISGSSLIFIGLRDLDMQHIIIFFGLGLAAIVAALKYTMGKNPYGYRGWGDLFVFIFFGLVGVIGTFYLHTLFLDWMVIMPAIVIGLLSMGVLNINNIRDVSSDKESGKNTLVVQLGLTFARFYHIALIGLSLLLSLVFTLVYYTSAWQLLFLISVPLFIRNAIRVYHNKSTEHINGELKSLALTTFLFAILFALGLVL